MTDQNHIRSENAPFIWHEIRGNAGPKVLLLHGWGCDHRTMAPLAGDLEKDFTVLSVDFPGHGQSPEPPEPWGVGEYAEALRALLTRTEFFPASVVGHSFGCRVAARLAATHPDYVRKMVFTGAAGLRAPESPEAAARKAHYQRLKKKAQALEKIPGLRALGGHFEEKLRQKYGSRDYLALNENMRKTFVKIVNEDLSPFYPRIAASTLLIWGDADTETPLWMGQKMESLIPDAGLVILEGGTHFAFLEQPQRFNTIVHHFLTED